MTYRISPSDVHLIMSLCLLEMDHHLDWYPLKTYLLRTESLYVNEEINNDPQDLEAGLNAFAMRGIRLDNPL